MSEADSNGSTNGGQDWTLGLATRFRKGCPAGPGNPNLATMNRHRAALLRSIKDSDIEYATKLQVELMRNPKVAPSIRLAASIAFQNRAHGLPATVTELQIIAEVEIVKQKLHLAGHPDFSAPDSAPRQLESGVD
jgi:hypothetical protein